jgi:hypothetical protein
VVTIRQFVGAMLEQITRARVAADAASVRVAHQYLQHEVLKGFSVPGMHVREVELELTFAVAPGWKPAGDFAGPDARLSAVNQLEHFVEQLPDHAEVKPYFDRDRGLAARWRASLPALRERFDRTLADNSGDAAPAAAIGLLIENHFYATVQDGRELLSLITLPFTRNRAAAPRPAVHQYILDGVSGILDSVSQTAGSAEALLDAPDIRVLIGSDELDRVPRERLHRMKLTIGSNDRRWVVSEADGQQVHTLTRSAT